VDSFVPGGHAIATDDVALLREVEVTLVAVFAVDDTGNCSMTRPDRSDAADLRRVQADGGRRARAARAG
jgi:hypothetical protein